MPDKYYQELIKLTNKAMKKNEVPVAALIVYNNKIIAKAYNQRDHKHNVLNHAEIIAILKASKKLHDWRLNNCNLYVTLKPCSMCESIIKQSRINNVYYLLDKPLIKKEYNKTNIEQTNVRVQEQQYASILNNFFQEKRSK